ncbi:MAG: hypothetical protein HYU64_03150, partial [Armatimonadetes bacterium]|nr:hypothetical protein [Armatimonadota bacterium]
GGRPAIAAMNYMKYDGMGLGRTDLLWSRETLFQRIRDAHFPVLAANLRMENSESLSPYEIKEISGVRVALLGIVPPLSTEPGKSGEWCGLVIEKPGKALRDLMGTLRDQADLFVLLSSLGASENEKLAQEVPGIPGHPSLDRGYPDCTGGQLREKPGQGGPDIAKRPARPVHRE